MRRNVLKFVTTKCAGENFGISEQSDSNWLYFGCCELKTSEIAMKGTQIDSCAQRRFSAKQLKE
jgi:hypothetical protein